MHDDRVNDSGASIDKARATRLSKFLSFVLRHKPEAAGLALDAGGWAEIDALLTGATSAGEPMTRAELEAVVATSDKQRYGISTDGRRVRANQGHSIDVDLGLAPVEPPATLYHGTVEKFLDAIRREGLRPMTRQHVHLSPDIETASKVGQRRGKPVILKIDAAAMHAAGHAFYVSANGVWLVDAVPPEHLSIPT